MTFDLLLNPNLFKKGDGIQLRPPNFRVIVVRRPQDGWYHKLLKTITFGWFKPSKYYKVKTYDRRGSN